MGQIDIPFNDWSRRRHQTHEKRATTRTSRYGEPGDVFNDGSMEFQLTHVVRLPLGVVGEYFYELEGAESQEEFREVWEDIHYRRGYDEDWTVWLHLYHEVDG